MKRWCDGVAMLAAAGCGRADDGNPPPAQPEGGVPPAVPAPGTGPDAKTPLAPVKQAIDPKSSEAAEQLARGFALLLNEGKFDEAYMLLGPNAGPRKDFDLQLRDIKNLNVTVGKPGGQDGAAGSIYIGIPLTISGEASGEHVSREGRLILRRVNDVPGSTEAQRCWHSERLNLSGND